MHGLAAALARRGHQTTVVTLDRGPDGEPLPPGERDNVRYHRLPRLGHPRYPFAAGLIRALSGADLVHVHGIDGLADQVALARPGVPAGLSTHGGYFHTPWAHRIKQRWWRTVTLRTLRHLDAVWFSSEADAERLGDLRGSVVENGIDAARFAIAKPSPSANRWLVLGRVVPHKGLGDLIAAMAMQRAPVGELDVVGPITDRVRAELTDAVRGLPTRVRIWGARPRDFVRDRLARAAWAVFPSRYEGFGLAALEVMGAGVPVIVSDIPALRDAVRDGGGRVVDFRDPRRAAEALDRIRSLPLCESRSAEARAAGWSADWDARVIGFEDAYHSMLGAWS